jgi:hypothetical protein
MAAVAPFIARKQQDSSIAASIPLQFWLISIAGASPPITFSWM